MSNLPTLTRQPRQRAADAIEAAVQAALEAQRQVNTLAAIPGGTTEDERTKLPEITVLLQQVVRKLDDL